MQASNIVDYLLEPAAAAPDRPYLLGLPGGPVGVGAIRARAGRVGALLKGLGIGRGDRVLFAVQDGADFPALFLGAIAIGAIALPVSTFLKPGDYAYLIADSEAVVAVVDPAIAPAVEQVRDRLPQLRHLLVTGAALDATLAGLPDMLEPVACHPDDAAFWLYSSGSTGDPKGVIHTHAHIYWATELFGLAVQGFGPSDVVLCPPKMFFAFGLGNQVYFPLRAGSAVVVNPGPARPDTMLALLEAHHPTLFVSVPTLYAGILNLVRDNPERLRRAAQRLRFCVSGGEVLPPAILERWRTITGVEILDGVGTTELTHMFLLNRPGQVVPGSCGRIVEGYQAEVLDEAGRPVPVGEIGDLFVRGPTAATQYWNKPEKTRAAMRDGGVLTGDKVRQDADGNFFYVGRNDDMLRVGGIWVSPAEIESALAEHPAVLECAVIGHPDEAQLIKPKAYVILREAGAVEAEALRDFLRDRLAHYKCPRWIELVAELPKTATGKIQRFRLRQLAMA